MSGPAGQATGDGSGTIHALEELARLAAVLDEFMNMGIGSGMTLGEFDGFVAAVAVCPDAVPASDWLTEVWGSKSSRDANCDQRCVVLILVIVRLNGRDNPVGCLRCRLTHGPDFLPFAYRRPQ